MRLQQTLLPGAALAAGAVLVAGVALIAGPEARPGNRPVAPNLHGPGPIIHEGPPDQPWLPGPGPQQGGIAAGGAAVVFGEFTHVQVNVDANGNNIPGDAGNEPSIAVDPTAPDRMAIGWRQFDTILSSFRQAGYSYTRDGGRSWAGMQIIEQGIFRSDPVLDAGPDGTFFYSSLSIDPIFQTDMFISSDWGATWPDKHFSFGGDKQWFVIDQSGGLGDGHSYQAWNIAGNEFFPGTFNRSVDTGIVWEDPVQYDPIDDVAFPVFGTMDVGPDGKVYVAGAQNANPSSNFWVVRSTNAENSGDVVAFDQITAIDVGGDLVLGTGPNPSGLLGQVNCKVNPMNGEVYVLATVDPQGPDPMDINFIRSTDDGANFGAPIRVTDDAQGLNRWSWFGQMDVAPNGRIDVVFNDTRDSLQDNLSALYYTFSTDGGVSWAPNQQISPVFDSHLGFPQQNKLGDYYDLVSDNVGADLAWAATFNLEQDVYYTRIGDYDCNRNDVGDADDLANETSQDCNFNDIPDECEIAAGEEADDNGNGVPDSCEGACPYDCADGNGVVDTLDFLALLGQWDEVGAACDPGNDGVDTVDFLALLAAWGPCP